MATESRRLETSISAGEDLRAGCRYHAIALDDGKLGNNGRESGGILLNKPNTNEFATIGYLGEMTFAAGAGVSAGAKITVTTSGWFVTAASGSVIVGRCKASVTSGSFGVGLFSFPTAFYAETSASAV